MARPNGRVVCSHSNRLREIFRTMTKGETMRRQVVGMLAIATVMVLWVGMGAAQIQDGVQTGAVAGEPATTGHHESVPGDIDFDDATAPCNFAQTIALTTEYAALGVIFGGPDGLDGGAILDECGNFGVTGHSPPNFLAFNVNSSLQNGATPQGPEQMSFSEVVDTVTINGGHSSSGTITLECFDGAGASVGMQSITGSSALQPLTVSAAGQIDNCWLSFTGPVAVFDDLTYNPPIPVELQSISVE